MPLPRIHRARKTFRFIARAAPPPPDTDSIPTAKRKRPSTALTFQPPQGPEDSSTLSIDDTLDRDWPEDRGSTIDIDELTDRLRDVLEPDDEEESNAQKLPWDIDLEEVQQSVQYEGLLPQEELQDDTAESMQTVEFDRGQTDNEDIREEPNVASPASMLPPQSRRLSEDTSEKLPQPRIHDEEPDQFLLALGLWCEEVGISCSQYSGLREILAMLEPHSMLNRLPTNYGPLRRRTKGHIPQLSMRRTLLALAPNKLASKAEKAKKKARLDLPKESPKAYLYFFDSLDLFQTILRSDLTKKMYFGIGEFCTNPVEVWQSRAWTSSVRTTSGQFARYRTQKPMFPSDWVVYSCSQSGCTSHHLGRIVEVGLDYRDDATSPGKLKIKVQCAFWNKEIPQSCRQLSDFQPNEVLLRPEYLFLDELNISHRYKDILMDYGNFQSPQPIKATTLIVKHMINEKMWMQPLAWASPVRAELELQAYGRDYFYNNFDCANGGKCLSLPFFLFIDGFGLYRNAYRSLMGVYIQIAAFRFHERMRRANVFPLTLGPHGSNLNDVVNSLQGIRNLDRGVVLELPQPTRVCAFVMCFLGDMPQQQANSGFKSQRATKGCRFCLVSADARADLNFDIVKGGRFHSHVLQQRRHMDSIRSITKKEAFATEWGLLSEEPALFKLTPALDIILSRPSDPAHSEYAGLCMQIHHLLLEAILTATAIESYATALRSWPFAPGFARLQSPLHHLKSYSLSEHARWIVVAPGLLRCWLRDDHIQQRFLDANRAHLTAESSPFTVAEFVVRTVGFVAQSTSLLMTDLLLERERGQLMEIVKKARHHFQLLLKFAAVAANTNPRSRSVTPMRRGQNKPAKKPVSSSATDSVGDLMSDMIPSIEATNEVQAKKAQEFDNDQKRPNMHIALHYEATMREYGMPSNVNVLIGEDKHRYFKKIVYQTNHVNVESLLLSRENLRQSVRLILMNGFPEEPKITCLLQDLYGKCPSLFDTLLPRSEQQSLRSALEVEEEEDSLVISEDTEYRHVTAIGRFKAKYCHEVLRVPTRTTDVKLMTPLFKNSLRNAFATDYKLPNVMHFGSNSLQWCKKISFTSGPSERRFTFCIGDFINFRVDFMGQVLGLFILTLSVRDPPRLFLRLAVVGKQQELDPVLEVKMYQLSDQELIIGLPSVQAARPYMLPVTRSGRQFQLRQTTSGGDGPARGDGGQDITELMYVPWTVEYL